MAVESLGTGIRVTEIASRDEAIETAAAPVTAFIGRTLRGPVDTPVAVSSLASFTRRFGGPWTRSSLGPAVQQFFEHGGRKLYIVRVANNAHGAMICLPGHHGVLVLRALEPGSTECVRVAVDYDGIADEDEASFNLTVQRVSPGTGHVADQEIYRRVTLDTDSRHYIGDALAGSSIVKLQDPLPAARPTATMGRGIGRANAYVGHAQPGTDGGDLSDYDLIGSAARGSGLFAIDQLERIDILYMPPPGRGADTGPAALLAAERYCRRRGAMLVMDPPAAWASASDAVAGVRQAGYASSNALCYFPRLHLCGECDRPPRAGGGAIAGMLYKADTATGPWAGLEHAACVFRRGIQPSITLTDADAALLNRVGLNAVLSGAHGLSSLHGNVTLARGTEADRQYVLLPSRRLSLGITNTIERATRWAAFEADGAGVAARVRTQIDDYLLSLADQGAFADARYSVQCETGRAPAGDAPMRTVTILLTFRPHGCDEAVSLTLLQSVSGCRVTVTAFAPVAEECA